LIEIIRTTKDRYHCATHPSGDPGTAGGRGSLVPLLKDANWSNRRSFAEAAEKVRVFGIELLDIRFSSAITATKAASMIYDR